ncbi:TrbC/VirB2 family protein [Rhizobium sp. TRM95111]|uniref:TrbC/VirB2 family protein n=1 Tax=Rhizobium alarense TaxID=2846851 RepID=UPI001F44AFE2|nr:TrbC/VirB2 family protein [Rhizobium alarense]MCF3642943.1 TrbC/VirB2 family protein [Rhizobium alarense]
MKFANINTRKPSRALAALAILLLAGFVVATPAMAQGLDKVNEAMENILALLRGVSITVVTIAIIWSGYKMAFQHARFADVVPVLGGGLMVGVAAEVARYLLG